MIFVYLPDTVYLQEPRERAAFRGNYKCGMRPLSIQRDKPVLSRGESFWLELPEVPANFQVVKIHPTVLPQANSPLNLDNPVRYILDPTALTMDVMVRCIVTEPRLDLGRYREKLGGLHIASLETAPCIFPKT